MRLLILVLGGYCLGATVVLFRARYYSAIDRDLSKQLERVALEELTSVQRIEVMAKLADIQSKRIPWYERSLSTIGVIAFFSMLIATGLQTTNANISAAKLQQLQSQLETLEAQQISLEPAVARAAQAAIEQYWAHRSLDVGAEEILRSRLSTLKRASTGGSKRIAEMLDIALVLGDFKEALSLVEDHPEFLETAKPFQLVSIAECYFISGSTAHVAEILRQLDRNISTLNSSSRFRVLVLRASLAPDVEPYVREAAGVLRTDTSAARIKLRYESAQLWARAHEFAQL